MDTHLLNTLIRTFLEEDIGRGDITSESIFSPEQEGRAQLVARHDFITAGFDQVASRVFQFQNPLIQTEQAIKDGTMVTRGDVLLTVFGPVVDLLKAERVALNLVQRLSGIATFTNQFVKKVEGTAAKVTDTRKTTPGLRMLEKYAVTCGGGHNHRYNLADGVLIKDNHIAACGSIKGAVEKVRAKIPHTIKVEVETDTLEQVKECVACGVDIIMLDNMSVEMMIEAVQVIEGRAIVEASGNVNLQTIEGIAKCGVDIISIGALTHSAPSCDIGMDWIT